MTGNPRHRWSWANDGGSWLLALVGVLWWQAGPQAVCRSLLEVVTARACLPAFVDLFSAGLPALRQHLPGPGQHLQHAQRSPEKYDEPVMLVMIVLLLTMGFISFPRIRTAPSPG